LRSTDLETSEVNKALELARGRPVCVLGYGVTGRALAAFLKKESICHRIFDGNGAFAKFGVELDFTPRGDEFVIYSPGFIGSQWLREAQSAGCITIGELDYCQLHRRGGGQTIAVTGTLGKTSTTMMLEHVLRGLGERCMATGNVGNPLIGAVDGLEADENLWNICEVSSFQAYDMKYFSPDYVIWTNFSPNHLDLHGSLEKYWAAKLNLLCRCGKTAFVGEDVAAVADRFGQKLPDGVQIAKLSHCGVFGGPLAMAHQRANYVLVRSLLAAIGFDPSAVDGAICGFRAPPYRLELWGTVGDVEIWNDSKATTSAAVAAAIGHVRSTGRKCLWLCCGRGKGEPLENFRPSVECASAIICFGEMAPEMTKTFGQKVQILDDHRLLFEKIGEFSAGCGDGWAVLFSPGFTSFDLFSNYMERGEWFDCGMGGLCVRFGGRKSEISVN
jgi:UDP-N-acetylmuramoylalanine--D-glutamate ligase